MTYADLSKIKTNGFITNHVIDNVVNSARWSYTRSGFKKALVTDQEIEKIVEAAKVEGIELYVSLAVAFAGLLKHKCSLLPHRS